MAILPMAKNVLKNLFRKPATAPYPFGPKEFIPKSRGKLEIDIDTCIFCSLCQKKCPTQAITVDRTKKEWSVDRLRCISCSACCEACPKKCLDLDCKYSAPTLGPKVDWHKQSTESGDK